MTYIPMTILQIPNILNIIWNNLITNIFYTLILKYKNIYENNNITPFSLKTGTLNYLVFSSYLFIKSFACINK